MVRTPRVLKDGADSVGVLGALNRVYINIGLFSEEWTTHFKPVVGGRDITPIEIATAQENSAYWQATEAPAPADEGPFTHSISAVGMSLVHDGAVAEPCEFATTCDPGLACIAPSLVPGCMKPAGGCCSSFCDLSDATTSAGVRLSAVIRSTFNVTRIE